MCNPKSKKAAVLVLVVLAGACGNTPARCQTSYQSLSSQLAAHFPQVKDRSRSYLSGEFVRDTELRREFNEASIATSNLPDAARGLKVQKDTILLQLRPSADVQSVEGLLKKYDLRVVSGVPEIGLLIIERSPGLAVSFPPDESHDPVGTLRKLMKDLRNEPLVSAAAPNTLLGTTLIPRPSDGKAISFGGTMKVCKWDWSEGAGSSAAGSTDGNWGQKFLRFPAAWNFNDGILRARPSGVVNVGILDVGFAPHIDLDFVAASLVPLRAADHGNHVTGIVAARFDDQIGCDGGSRFARVTVCTAADLGGGSGIQGMQLILSDVIATLVEFIVRTPDLRAINLSLGYNWVPNFDRNPSTDPAIKTIVQSHGVILRAIADLAQERKILLVCAAGNDSCAKFPNVDAQWSSPFNWAALNNGISNAPAANVLVIESIGRGGARSVFSNVNGHLAAPGEDILSTTSVARNSYGLESGTSMATPQVTALIAQLYAYNPDLTPDRVVSILKTTAVPAPHGSHAPTIDAFAAMLACYEGDRPLHDLADLDHSGRVDMADFLIFKNALHQVEGSPIAPPQDLNGDGVVGSGSQENVWPACDLNGSGKLSRDVNDRRRVKGTDITDLEVMMRVWEDPTIKAVDLLKSL
jgi:Subtilase family